MSPKLPDILLDLMSKGRRVLRNPSRLDQNPVEEGGIQTLRSQSRKPLMRNSKVPWKITFFAFPVEVLGFINLYILSYVGRLQLLRFVIVIPF